MIIKISKMQTTGSSRPKVTLIFIFVKINENVVHLLFACDFTLLNLSYNYLQEFHLGQTVTPINL